MTSRRLAACPETKSTAPTAEDQHPILEMESLTQEDKNHAGQRNGSRPNRQPKQRRSLYAALIKPKMASRKLAIQILASMFTAPR
jgi:hypothetical protein